MKRQILLSLFFLLPLLASAVDTPIDGLWYSLDTTTKEAEVIKYKRDRYAGDVVIPSIITYKDVEYRVTSIGSNAFYDCYDLISCTIPNSVVAIGEAAFQDCSSLTSLSIPESVTTIGSSLFENCYQLASVSFGSSVTSIGERTFFNCYKLTSIAIPDHVTTIGDFAFTNCRSLVSITIPNSVTSIGWEAFSDCRKMTSMTVEEGNPVFDSREQCNAIIRTETNELAFGCQASVIPNSVSRIGAHAFSECTVLTSITIPNSVITIGDGAFSDCTKLASVSMGSNVTDIGSSSFEGCKALTSITIPDNVTSIGDGAFYGCTKLGSVTIGSGVTYGGSKGFMGCTAIKTVTVRQPSPFKIYEDTFDKTTYRTSSLYIPTGRKAFFQEHSVWGKFANIEEEDMPDVVNDISPFDDLYSGRLILSYTDREKGGSVFGNHDEYDVVQAIKFPVERMARIKGNKLTHIRFNMWPEFEHVSDMKVFIGSSRDKRDLVCQSVANLHEGWNEVALNQPYTITGDSIIVGVEYFKGSEDSQYPIKWDSYEGHVDGGCLLYCADQWSANEGTWIIQCMVEGDNIPKYDVHIEELIEPLYKRNTKAGEPYEFSINLRNWGSMPIDRYEMQAQLDGKDVKCSPKWNDNRIERGSSLQTAAFQVTPAKGTPAGHYRLSISPKSLGGEEYNGLETSLETTLKVYEHDMGRQKVLVQVYTGTWCGYCPEFETLVEEKKEERNDLAVVSIHSIDYNYITPASESYLSMMYRNGFPDVDLNRCIEKVPLNFREHTMKNRLDEAKEQPSLANVNIRGSYDEKSHVLNLTVSGECNEDFFPVEEWTNLTVLLVEDDIIGTQSGAEDPYNYHHQAVLRTNLSDIWGDRVKWNGNKYEMHYTASLDDLTNVGGYYNADNIRVVAFLSKPFTGNNYEEIGVVNCDEISLQDLTTGIHEVDINSAPKNICDLNGRMISRKAESLDNLPHGIYIVSGKKVVK